MLLLPLAFAAAFSSLSLGQEASSSSTVAADGGGVTKKTLKLVRGLKNVSKETGDFLKLRCDVEGDTPATGFKWLVNDALLVEEKNRVRVKTNLQARPQYSKLTIKELETLDKAFYKCVATNGVDSVSSQVSHPSMTDFSFYF